MINEEIGTLTLFLLKNIIITTALPPEKVYKNLDKEDSMSQLYRRFKVYKCIDWENTLEKNLFRLVRV